MRESSTQRKPLVFRLVLWACAGSVFGLIAFSVAMMLLLAMIFALVGGGTAFATSGGSSSLPDATCTTASPACQAVGWALQMAAHLHGNPDVTYDTGFPRAIIQYGERTCPGCAAWENGQFQCVVFVLGSYGYVRPFPLAGNANTWWGEYAHQPGYVEISAADQPGTATPAPLSSRGLPAPGDVMAWYGGANGHVSIVLAVKPPQGAHPGSLTFAQANGQMPVQTLPLLPDLIVDTQNGYWNNFTVAGYIRLVQ
jgi:hypothetical protein